MRVKNQEFLIFRRPDSKILFEFLIFHPIYLYLYNFSNQLIKKYQKWLPQISSKIEELQLPGIKTKRIVDIRFSFWMLFLDIFYSFQNDLKGYRINRKSSV